MFGSDKCNVARGQGATSNQHVPKAALVRGAGSKCAQKAIVSAAQSSQHVPKAALIRGGSPAGCGSAVKDTAPDPGNLIVGVETVIEGGISQPTALEFVPPPAYTPDDFWRDDDLFLVQDEDDALNIVDNA